jgi:hypothetical protein
MELMYLGIHSKLGGKKVSHEDWKQVLTGSRTMAEKRLRAERRFHGNDCG